MTFIGKSLWNMEVFIEMGKGACDGYYLYIDKKKHSSGVQVCNEGRRSLEVNRSQGIKVDVGDINRMFMVFSFIKMFLTVGLEAVIALCLNIVFYGL